MTDTTPLLNICRRLVDPHAQPITTHPGHNGTKALRAITTGGEVIVKLHRSPERHRHETHAYQRWTAALHGGAATLLATSYDPPAVIITALPGVPLAHAALEPAQETHAHHQAGALLHRLHHAAPPRPESDMTAWLAERGEHWLALATDIIPAARLAEIRSHLRSLAALGPIPAVPCHLDYTPRNLLAEPTGEVAVIDFEHAREVPPLSWSFLIMV